MTDVKRGNVRLIASEEEARTLYKPAPPGQNGKIGIEVEMPLYRPGRDKSETPTAADVLGIQEDLKSQGIAAQLEASGVIEYASDPVALADAGKLAAEARRKIAAFDETIERHGYVRAPFCIVPTTTLEEAYENRGPRERLEVCLQELREKYPREALPTPLLTTGVQTNFSPASNGELFRMTVRGYALAPLLIAAMNSSSGYVDNRDENRSDVHLRSVYYAAYGTSGGISPAFLASTDAESFIRNHVTEVFDAPMLFAYDLEGNLIRGERGEKLTFRKLAERGLNTQSNYELAETFLYHDVKIANIRASDGDAIGKRVEIRPADSGPHQPFSTLLLTAALIPDGPTAEKIDALLKDYGFTGNPVKDAALLQASHDAAVNHHGRFMDVPFGTGHLRDFAADVAGLIVEHYGHDRTVAADVSKLAELLLTGECDAKHHAETYKTLQDVTRDLQKAPVRRHRTHVHAPKPPKKAA